MVWKLKDFFSVFYFRTCEYKVNCDLDTFQSILINAFDNDLYLPVSRRNQTDNSFHFAISKYMPGFYCGIERGTGHIKGGYSDNVDSKLVTSNVRPNIGYCLSRAAWAYLFNIYLPLYTHTRSGTILFKIAAFVFCLVPDYIMAKRFSDTMKENFEDVIKSNLVQ